MKIYRNQNVFDAAIERINFIFDEFENVVIGISGGKDSTVIFNLAKKIAKERNRLPLNVLFIDQEAELESVISHVKTIMYDKDVNPLWFQMPIKIFNATSIYDHWLMCWEPGKEWMREREEISIKENIFGTDRFAKLFGAIFEKKFPDKKSCYISGVRTEESPTRFIGLTSHATYKYITWGKILNKKKEHYTFYPIYDWSISDVWKSIFDNKWDYCKYYDSLYSYGVPPIKMRVSNVHHETAIHSLFNIQEIEPETYQKLTKRIQGIDMAGKFGIDDYFIRNLPFMFTTWKEYRDYLLEKLITNEDWKKNFMSIFKRQEDIYYAELGDSVIKTHVSSILTNDWEHVKLLNFERRPAAYVVRRNLPSMIYRKNGNNKANKQVI